MMENTVVAINSKLIREFDVRPKPRTISEVRNDLERMIYRAKYHGESITLQMIIDFEVDLKNAQFEDEGAQDVLDETQSLVSGYSRFR